MAWPTPASLSSHAFSRACGQLHHLPTVPDRTRLLHRLFPLIDLPVSFSCPHPPGEHLPLVLGIHHQPYFLQKTFPDVRALSPSPGQVSRVPRAPCCPKHPSVTALDSVLQLSVTYLTLPLDRSLQKVLGGLTCHLIHSGIPRTWVGHTVGSQ